MNRQLFSRCFILVGLLLAGCAPAARQLSAEQSLESKEVEKPRIVETQLVAATKAPEATKMSQPYPLPYETGFGTADLTSGDQMTVKDAEIELLVADPDRALKQVTQMVADYEGYIISSQTWYREEHPYATLRLAIPSDAFETALNFLRTVGVKVLHETASGQDVSAEYADLQARLANLEATAARVRSFLEDAKTVSEALQVNQTLSQLEGEIEQVKGRMKYYEGRTAFSTITVILTPLLPTPTPTPTVTPTPSPAWSPVHTFNQASNVLVQLLQRLVDGIIWLLVVVGPFILVAGLLIWGGRSIARRRQKR